MNTIRFTVTHIVLLLLALAGVGIAVYLTTVHYEHVPLLCSSSGIVDCQRVTSSAYSVIPGTTIPITVPGIGWAAVSALLAILELRSPHSPAFYRRLIVAHMVWSLLALLFVLYLVYAEIVLLRTICAWCTGLHIIILLTFLITLLQVLSPEPEEDEPEEQEKQDISSVPGTYKR